MKHKVDHFDKFLKVFGITFFSLSILFLVYAVLFANKALPNTYFSHLSVAGKEHDQIAKIVNNQIQIFEQKPVIINVGTQSYELTLVELGISYSTGDSVENIINATIASNPLEDYRNRFTSLFFNTYLMPSYDVDYKVLNNRLEELFVDLEKKPKDAQIIVSEGATDLQPEQVGVVIDRSVFLRDLTNRLDNFSSQPVKVLYIARSPKLYTENSRDAFEKRLAEEYKLFLEMDVTLRTDYSRRSQSA